MERLAGLLAPQLVDGVEAVVLWNRGRRKLGEYRTRLLNDAAGEYVSFVDDDDRVPDYYVAEVLRALEFRPDQVGFKVEFKDIDGQVRSAGSVTIADHSLRHGRWYETRTSFFRDVSHLNPIRRELALTGSFEGTYAEDVAWANTVRSHVSNEVYVDRVMYFYDFSQSKSIRHGKPGDGTPPVLPAGFRYHPESEV